MLMKTNCMERISIRRDILLFLKQPDYEIMPDQAVKSKLLILFKVLVLTYLGIIIVSIPLNILQKLEIVGETIQKTTLVYEVIKVDFVSYRPYFLLAVVLIGPITEELSFRLALGKYDSKLLSISISIFAGILFGDYLSQFLWVSNSYIAYLLIYCIYILLITGTLFFIVRMEFFKRNLDRIKTGWNAKPGLVFYIVAALFAIVHINNLEFRTNDLIFLPLILLPFFIYGLSLGYIRIRLGMKYSILFHVFINAMVMALIDLGKH